MTTLRDTFDHTYEKGGFTYVSWSQVADRLDEATGNDWSFEIRQLGDDWCWGKLTIGERHYENVGYAENTDAAWKKEVLKDAVSDALKRCAAMAGVARYLYDKDAPTAAQNGHAAPVVTRPVAVAQRSSTTVPDDLDWDRLSPTPPVATMTRPALSEGENFCPVHGLAWKLNPAGVSKTSGKAYGAFWACSSKDKPYCQEKPTHQWVDSQR